jgi:beta-N-acetylhexosaminidase
MVLVSHTPAAQERTWKTLIKGLHTNRAFHGAIVDSVRRILETKIRYSRDEHAPLFPDPADVTSRVPAPGARDFFMQVSARAVTLVAGKDIPYRPGQREKILLCGQFPEFLAEGQRRYPRADTFPFPFAPFYAARPQDKAAIRSRAARYDTIIFCLANYNSLDVLQQLKGMNKKVLVMSALSPVYLSEAPWLETAIAVYGDGTASFRAGFAALAGDFAPGGTLPVRFAVKPVK